MENLENKPLNPNLSQTPNTSEFAEKQPLIDVKTSNLLRKVGIGGGIFLGILILISIVVSIMPKQSPIASTGDVLVEDPITSLNETKEYFAYIKDSKAIWIADLKGENKQMIIDISPSSTSVFSTLTWKTPTDITYTICADANTECSIKTINIESKSITDEYNSTNFIKKISWDKTSNYIAFIEYYKAPEYQELNEFTNFTMKTGTILSKLNSFLKTEDPSGVNNRVIFSGDNQYVAFYSVMTVPTYENDRLIRTETLPVIEVYLLNGTKVDRIENARDPFFITENKIGYIRDGQIVYKIVGTAEETIATVFNGYNPSISPDKNLIAYWYYEGNLNNVVLGLFDTNLNIHRNILRGIVLPTWVSNDLILGIKADNCLQGSSCQLYQFQTNSISLVDIKRGNVVQVDQGKRISEPSFVFFEKTTE
jgi:hypothetical protein